MTEIETNSKNVQNVNNEKALEGEQLVIAVRNQIEYYFSKDNLKSDQFLLAQMDSQNSVPLTVVMKFAKLASLTQDEEVVKAAIQGSSIVSLQDGRIKANIKFGRSTIILREIPSDAPEEEVKEIFNFPDCKPIVSIRSEIGDTWFVSTESEDDAKDLILDLKLKKRTFRGVAVKARLKTETTVKSYFSAPVVPPPLPPFMGMPYAPYGPPDMYPVPPAGYVNNANMEPLNTNIANRMNPDKLSSPPKDLGSKSHDGEPGSPTHNKSGVNATHKTDGGNKDKSASSTGKPNTSATSHASSSAVKGGKSTDHKKGATGGAHHGKHKDNHTANIEINALNFPPLPADHVDHHVNVANVNPVHNHDIKPYHPSEVDAASMKKYTIDDVIAIVRDIREAPLPASIKTHEHPFIMTTTPNVDLLLRQRTFSIDETKAQMQLGRPVLREAVAPGSVDYGSMMYGENDAGSHNHPGTAATQGAAASGGAAKPAAAGSWAGVLKAASTAPPKPVESTATSANTATSPNKQSKGGSEQPQSHKKGGASAEKGSNNASSASSSATNTATNTTNANAASANNASGGDDGSKSVSSTSKKSKGDKKSGDKKEGGKKEGKKKSDNKEEAPSTWGGKMTFANILKQPDTATPPTEGETKQQQQPPAAPTQQQAPAAQQSTSKSSSNSKSNTNKSNSSNDKKSSSNNNNSNNQQRSNKGDNHNKKSGSSSASSSEKGGNGGASAATWAKAKLPPLNNENKNNA